MWAYSVVAPKLLAEITVPTPSASGLAEGQVLLRMLAGGICGSDFDGFVGHAKALPGDVGPYAPNFPGYPLHEIVGEVVASRDVRTPVGSRVVGWASALNALSEYVVTSGGDVVAISDSWESITAILLQPLACVLYAVDQLRRIEGCTAAVIGQGSIGVLFSHVLSRRGALQVTGVDVVDRTDIAAFFGIDQVIHGSSDRWVAQLNDDERPQVVVEVVGHQSETLSHAVEAVAKGGEIYYFGVPQSTHYALDLSRFMRKNLRLTAGITLRRSEYLKRAVEYVEANPDLKNHYVTDVFDINDVQAAFERAIVPARGRLKVAIRMA